MICLSRTEADGFNAWNQSGLRKTVQPGKRSRQYGHFRPDPSPAIVRCRRCPRSVPTSASSCKLALYVLYGRGGTRNVYLGHRESCPVHDLSLVLASFLLLHEELSGPHNISARGLAALFAHSFENIVSIVVSFCNFSPRLYGDLLIQEAPAGLPTTTASLIEKAWRPQKGCDHQGIKVLYSSLLSAP